MITRKGEVLRSASGIWPNIIGENLTLAVNLARFWSKSGDEHCYQDGFDSIRYEISLSSNCNYRNTKTTDGLESRDHRQDHLMTDTTTRNIENSYTKVDTCIVNEDGKIVSAGCYDMPIGCDDNQMPWQKETGDGSQKPLFYGKLMNISDFTNYFSKWVLPNHCVISAKLL